MPQKSIITPILGNEYYHIFNRGNNGSRLFFNDTNYALFLKLYREFVSPYCETLAYCLIANHFHLLIKTNASICLTPSTLSGRALVAKVLPTNGTDSETDFLLMNNHYQWDDVNGKDVRPNQFDQPCQSTPSFHDVKSTRNARTDLPKSNQEDGFGKAFGDSSSCLQNPQKIKKTNASNGLQLTDKEAVGRFISEQFRRVFLQYALIIKKQEDIKGSLFVKPFRRLLVEKQDYLEQVIFYIHMNPAKHGVQQEFKTYKYSSYQAILSDKHSLVSKDHVLAIFGGIKGFDDYHDLRWEGWQERFGETHDNGMDNDEMNHALIKAIIDQD